MSLESAQRFLEELDANEQAKALLQASDGLDEEHELQALAAAARETGYDVTDEELLSVFASSKSAVAAGSDAVAEEIAELSEEELDKVAGGKGHSTCEDTYLDNENCSLHDNCKKVIQGYYFNDNPYCDSYSCCKGVALKPDCKLGRIGF